MTKSIERVREELDLLKMRAYSHAEKSNGPKEMREWIDSNHTTVSEYITAITKEDKKLREAINDVPLPSVGDNSNLVNRICDWQFKHAETISKCGGE